MLTTFFPHIFDKNAAISFTLLDFVNLEKESLFAVLNKSFLIPFKTVILSMWSCFIVEALGWPEPTFLFNVTFNNKPLPNYLQSWKKCSQHIYFQSWKNPLVSHIFLSIFDFLMFVCQGVVLLYWESFLILNYKAVVWKITIKVSYCLQQMQFRKILFYLKSILALFLCTSVVYKNSY